MESQAPIQIPDIVHNLKEGQKLYNILNILLLPEASASFATAYFNIGGFALVKDSLTRIKSFRLLLGKEPTVRESFVTTDITSPIGEMLRDETEEAMGQRETPPLLEELVNFLQRDAVQVRLCLHFIHGKVYIIQGIPTWEK